MTRTPLVRVAAAAALRFAALAPLPLAALAGCTGTDAALLTIKGPANLGVRHFELSGAGFVGGSVRAQHDATPSS